MGRACFELQLLRRSNVGSHFTDDDQKKRLACDIYFILWPHMPFLYLTSLRQIARHKMTAPTVVFS